MAKQLDPREYSKRLHAHSKKGRQAFRKKYDPRKAPHKSGGQKQVSEPFTPQVNAATELKYGPTQRELESQQRGEAYRTQQTGDWYNDFLAKTTAMKTEQANRDAQLQQQVQAQAQQAQQTDQAGRQKVSEEAQADAAKRGGAVNPQISSDEQNAISSRRASADSYNNLINTLSRNQQTYLGGQENVVRRAGIEAKGRQQGRERKISQQLLDLSREKGAFKTDSLRQIQDDLAKRATEAAAFGQKDEALSLQKQRQQFDQVMSKMKFNQDASQFDVTSGIQQQNADSTERSSKKTGSKNKTGQPSKKDRTGVKAKLRSLTTQMQRSKNAKAGKGLSLQQQFEKRYPDVDPELIHYAAERAIYKKTSSKNRKQLHEDYGIGGW